MRRWLRSPDVQLAAGLGLLAAALRLPLALTSPLWQDEVASARILDAHTFTGAVRGVVRTESTPPLWYALAWLLHRAGIAVTDVRLLSVAADAALVALVVLLCARLMPLRFAGLAGALSAIGAELSGQGRWIRAYELFALLAVLLVFALLRAAAAPTRNRLMVLAATVAAASLTHYFFFFTLVAAAGWAAFEPAVRPVRRRLLAAMTVGLVPFAVWSPGFAAQFHHRRYGWIGAFDWREVVETPLRLFTYAGSGRPVLVGAIAGLLVCAAGCWALWRRGPAGRLCASFAVVPLILAAAVWAAGLRIYDVRNMIGIAPFVAVAIAAALASLPERLRAIVPAVVVAAACASFVWAQENPGPAYDRLAHALVADGWRTGDAVAVFGNRSEFRSPLEWYLPGNPLLATTAASEIDEPVFVINSKALLGDGMGIRRVSNLFVERLETARPELYRRLLRRANIFISSSPGPRVRV
jgi:hypothetical protein